MANETPLQMRVRYSGIEVDNGTMPLEEVVSALQGFAGAYGKIASKVFPLSSHELKVSAVEKGSFDLSILASITSESYKDTLEAIKTTVDGATYIFKTVTGLIDAKKHVKSRPYQISIEGSNNTTILINTDGASLHISDTEYGATSRKSSGHVFGADQRAGARTPEVIDLLTSRLVDYDLSKIASPLRSEAVAKAEISAINDDESFEASISSAEKPFFMQVLAPESAQNVELNGTLISLNKETLKGTFKRADNVKLPYRYIGDLPELLYSGFSHRDLVRIACIAYFDQNLVVQRLEIRAVSPIQIPFPFPLGDANTTCVASG